MGHIFCSRIWLGRRDSTPNHETGVSFAPENVLIPAAGLVAGIPDRHTLARCIEQQRVYELLLDA